MKDLLEISCGLDVHKEKIVACILTGPLGKPTHSEIREFSTLIPDMIALRNWIVSKNCHHVAMESTGIYWMPIYEILEDAFSGDITLLVVNARHMKNVPGKKTDMRTAVGDAGRPQRRDPCLCERTGRVRCDRDAGGQYRRKDADTAACHLFTGGGWKNVDGIPVCVDHRGDFLPGRRADECAVAAGYARKQQS